MPHFDPRTTALVLIDLQEGIMAMPLAPRDGPHVLAASKAMAETFRAHTALVVLVHVAWSADMKDAPPQNVDKPIAIPPGGIPAAWSALADGLVHDGDLVVTKRQWGAFFGTGLDLQLRRRGIKTIVLGGIATNFGVESTARHAWEHGYDVVIAEDLCATVSETLHTMAIEHIFPRISRVMTSQDIVLSPDTTTQAA